MKCCIECFKDIYIRHTIERQGTKGDSDFCDSKNIPVFDVTVSPNQIADMITSLVDAYTVSDSSEAKSLITSLHDDWDIFNVDAEKLMTLVKNLCVANYPVESDIFSKKVILSKITDEDFLKDFGVVKELCWECFAESIKYENRFHSGMFNADAFVAFLTILRKSYPTGTKMYRARISSSKRGFGEKEMGTPPKGHRIAGRINPEGIGILYLSSDDKTAIHEVRATTFDYITIGEFELTKDIKVVNLSGTSNISPFLCDDQDSEFVMKYAVNRTVFQEIAREFAKPLRRSDSPIEYLPTQYISEFIKIQNYAGVEYTSTLHKEGYNLAIFDENLFKCVDVRTVEIANIVYETE
jgi:hypothetical protein